MSLFAPYQCYQSGGGTPRDWSLITGGGGGGGGGATKWENRRCETFCAPHSRQGKTYCSPHFKEWKFFAAPSPLHYG